MTAALYFQALDARLSEKKAVAASTDKAKIAEGLADIHGQWAITHLTERAKRA